MIELGKYAGAVIGAYGLSLALLGWALMLLTAPVSAHMVGRSSYRTKHVLDETLIADDLAAALDEADTAESQGGADRPS